MEFGYFTLSDNHYENNTRSPNQFVDDITSEALYADQLGMHSAWIGEHHFNSLGVLSCPDLVLAYIAARTRHVRLAPAVTVAPLHNPIRIAEQWATLDLLSGGRVDFAAGRGYDSREYEPFHVSFKDNQSIFEEGMEVIQKLWAAEGRISHHGKHYQFDDVRITPKPVQQPLPAYVASFSKPSIELAARLGCGLIVAPFAAAMSFGGLKQVAELYHASCAKFGTRPGKLMCSYFASSCTSACPVWCRTSHNLRDRDPPPASARRSSSRRRTARRSARSRAAPQARSRAWRTRRRTRAGAAAPA